MVSYRPARFYGLYTCDWHMLDVDKDGIVCFAIQVSCVINFSVAIRIVDGKLGAIRVVTSQLGFARPFFIRFF